MTLIDRYVITTIVKATLLILLILVGIMLFIELANEMSEIGKGHYHILRALQYVLLILPRDLYLFFPMAGLVGAIIGLGLLASSSELVVMRATGVSVRQLCRMVLSAALLLCFFVTVLGEGVGPMLYKQGAAIKARAMYGSQALVTDQGLWMRVNHDFFHVEKVVDKKQLQDVTRYTFDENQRLLALEQAATVDFVDGQWLAHAVTQTTIGTDQTVTTQADRAHWDISLDPNVLSFGREDPMTMSLLALSHYIDYRASIGLTVSHDWLVFWQRVFQPLATLVMIFLAIPFVFGSLRSGTMGYRVLIGIVVGLVFYLVSQLTGQASLVYHIPPVLSALLPVIGFAVVGGLLLSRVR